MPDQKKKDPLMKVKALARFVVPNIDKIPTDTPEERQQFCESIVVVLDDLKRRHELDQLSDTEHSFVHLLSSHNMLIKAVYAIAEGGTKNDASPDQ